MSRRWLGNAALVAGSVLGYLVIRHMGGSDGTVSGSVRVDSTLSHVLLALVVILLAARAMAFVFRRVGQPPVMGEMVAGILLGPSLLGWLFPSLQAFLLPPSVMPFLGVLSQMGVVLYMFLVGLELDPGLLRKRGHLVVSISQASIVVPFLLGAALALPLYPRLSSPSVSFTSFSLFLGISMSVTAFPVLARILDDQKLADTRLGVLALAAAAIDDATAWCLLGLVVSVVQAKLVGAWVAPLLVVGFVAVMVIAVRPLMARLARRTVTRGVLALALTAMLLAALCTDAIGIHAVFGAFVLGVVIPHDSDLARSLAAKLEDFVVVLLLPAFFAFTGMKTRIGLLSTWDDVFWCGVIVLVASLGKLGGSFGAARLSGLPARESLGIGILMNTRGLMELVVLNIGLEIGVVSPRLFAMLVVMALLTTLATTPFLALVHAGGHRPALVKTAVAVRSRVLLPVSSAVGLPALLALARHASGAAPVRLLALGDVSLDDELGAVELQTVTGDPVDEICGAVTPDVGWVLLGFHRPGVDLYGGVVKDVFERVTAAHVGVVVHRHDGPLGQVVAVVDPGPHGRAVLELAVQVTLSSAARLRVVVVPGGDELAMEGLLRDASLKVGRWMFSDVLSERNPAQLTWKTRGDLVVLGVDRADELGLPLDEDPDGGRCVVIVQGATGEPSPRAR